MPDSPPARSEIPPAQLRQEATSGARVRRHARRRSRSRSAVIPARPLAVDLRWSDAMHDVQTRALQDVALVFDYLGRRLGRALSLGVMGRARRRRRSCALLAFAVAESVTPIATRSRSTSSTAPVLRAAYLQATGSSFPSGHVAYGGAIAVALVFLFTGEVLTSRRGHSPRWR